MSASRDHRAGRVGEVLEAWLRAAWPFTFLIHSEKEAIRVVLLELAGVRWWSVQ